MTAIDTQAIRSRVDAASAGPWFFTGYSGICRDERNDEQSYDEWAEGLGEQHTLEFGGQCPGCSSRVFGCVHSVEAYHRDPRIAGVTPSYGDTATGRHRADGEFIAHARADIPALLDALDAANAEIARLTAQLS